MTVKTLIEKNNLKVYNNGDTQAVICGGYAGDFLSAAMSSLKEGAIWFTIMNNVNVAAVAHLSECSAVIICQGIFPDEKLLNAAKTKNITLLGTDLDVYAAVLQIKL